MESEKLQIFVDGTVKYFSKFGGASARVGSPFLISSMNDHFQKYTSFISISGRDTGAVFFSSSDELLTRLLNTLNVSNVSEENLIDLAGEIANTISGNARELLGHEFIISTPIVLSGSHDSVVHMTETPQIYVIPIIWHNHNASLIISLD